MVTAPASALPSTGFRKADLTDLVPATKAQFANCLAPCLTLTAGVGMNRDARKEWYAAAYRALDGIPLGLLERGVEAAMKVADHPAKIVPAIMGEVRDAWERRRRLAAAAAEPVQRLAPPDPSPPAVPHEETQAILQRVWSTMSDHAPDRDPSRPTRVEGGSDRPGRMPTREDYIALGVDPAVLDAPSSEAA